jgi:hypothetical protein
VGGGFLLVAHRSTIERRVLAAWLLCCVLMMICKSALFSWWGSKALKICSRCAIMGCVDPASGAALPVSSHVGLRTLPFYLMGLPPIVDTNGHRL